MDKVTKIVRTIGPSLMQLFQKELPELMAQPKLRSLFFAILTRSLTHGDQDGYVVTSAEWIAYYVDEYAAYHSNNNQRFTAIKFLQGLKDLLPSHWELEWKEYVYTEGMARTSRLKVPTYIIEALQIDARDRPTPRYYLYKWGTKVTKHTNLYTNVEVQDLQTINLTEAKHPLQKDILDYTSSRDVREFRYMDVEAATNIINTYPHGKRECYQQALNTILDYPKPIYHPVKGCYRLYAPGLQFLKSDIRLALYPNSIELDLKSCHLAILAMVLDLKRTTEVLKQGVNVWTYLLTKTAGLYTPFIYPILRKVIKTTTYAVCFGASFNSAKKIFRDRLMGEGIKQKDANYLWKSYSEIDTIQELTQATYQWRESLRKCSEYTDPLGNIHAIETDTDVKSACFNICSAYELMLIHPIYKTAQEELSKNRALYRVMLHSHDGVTVSLAKPHLLNPVVSKLKDAVQEAAVRLNIHTTLELKQTT